MTGGTKDLEGEERDCTYTKAIMRGVFFVAILLRGISRRGRVDSLAWVRGLHEQKHEGKRVNRWERLRLRMLNLSTMTSSKVKVLLEQ